jgi:aryl-alcohol dehydrogenase-like predicted oxidoreductase
MNKIVLGTVQFGLDYGINNHDGKIVDSQVESILNLALDNEILNLDTAAAYGSSESIIGFFRQKNKAFKSFQITTKFKYKKGITIGHHVKDSIEKLNIKKLDSVLFHSYQDYIDFDLKSKPNEIKNIGVSLYTNEEIKEVINDSIIQSIQVPFNLLDNEFFRGSLLRKVKNKGIEVQVRSVFLQGLFFMKPESLPLNLKKLKSELKQLQNLAFENSISMSEMALGYVLSKSYIDKIVIGVDSVVQLKSNINASKTQLDVSIIRKIDSIITKDKNLLNPINWSK